MSIIYSPAELDALLADGRADECDECAAIIPVVPGGGQANRWHAPFCSLHDPAAD